MQKPRKIRDQTNHVTKSEMTLEWRKGSTPLYFPAVDLSVSSSVCPSYLFTFACCTSPLFVYPSFCFSTRPSIFSNDLWSMSVHSFTFDRCTSPLSVCPSVHSFYLPLSDALPRCPSVLRRGLSSFLIDFEDRLKTFSCAPKQEEQILNAQILTALITASLMNFRLFP